MDARSKAMATARLYEDFDPQTDWVLEDTVNTFLVYLPEFKKEHLRVQLTPTGVLKISGERPLGDNKWKRFMKEIRAAPDCHTKQITAKFEEGILYIIQPKGKPSAASKEEAAAVKPSSSGPAAATTIPKPTPSVEPAKLPTTQKADSTEDVSRAANEAEKLKKAEEETMKQNEGEAGKSEEQKPIKDEKLVKRKDKKKDSEIVSGVGREMFMALKRPENLKKVAATVLVAAAFALHIAYVKRICSRNEHQEL